MDGSFDVEGGLKIARRLLVELVNMGLPLATEALDPNSPQYLGDLFSWSAIGARTTESQTHREMASGLSMPVGFKNGTDGSLATAINAMRAAAMPHRFVGINQAGQVCLLQTQGNPNQPCDPPWRQGAELRSGRCGEMRKRDGAGGTEAVADGRLQSWELQ